MCIFSTLNGNFKTKKMHTQYQLTFFVRKSRSKKTTDGDVYMWITINNRRSDISISRKVYPRKWSSRSEKALGKGSEATELNNYINVLKNKVKNIHQRLVEKDMDINLKNFLDEFKGDNKPKPKMTLKVFQEHNEQWIAYLVKVFPKVQQNDTGPVITM